MYQDETSIKIIKHTDSNIRQSPTLCVSTAHNSDIEKKYLNSVSCGHDSGIKPSISVKLSFILKLSFSSCCYTNYEAACYHMIPAQSNQRSIHHSLFPDIVKCCLNHNVCRRLSCVKYGSVTAVQVYRNRLQRIWQRLTELRLWHCCFTAFFTSSLCKCSKCRS